MGMVRSPKIYWWSSKTPIRERTLQDWRSHLKKVRYTRVFAPYKSGIALRRTASMNRHLQKLQPSHSLLLSCVLTKSFDG